MMPTFSIHFEHSLVDPSPLSQTEIWAGIIIAATTLSAACMWLIITFGPRALRRILPRDRRRIRPPIVFASDRSPLEPDEIDLWLAAFEDTKDQTQQVLPNHPSSAAYIGETVLREITLEVLRMSAPSVSDIRLKEIRGPFRPGNWRIDWIDVLAEDYGAARDRADELQAERGWIMVPDGHPLDGQIYGKEAPYIWPSSDA